MLCYAWLCNVMLCYVTWHYVMLCFVTLRYVVLCYASFRKRINYVKYPYFRILHVIPNFSGYKTEFLPSKIIPKISICLIRRF